jgi:hypothetical protein
MTAARKSETPPPAEYESEPIECSSPRLRARRQRVTLPFAAKDRAINHAAAVRADLCAN